MFLEQHEREESLFKSHEETKLSNKNHNTATRLVNEKIEENVHRIERLEKQNHDFSESFSTCQLIQDDKVQQFERKIEKLLEPFELVKQDFE